MDVLDFGILAGPDAAGRRHVELVSLQSSALDVGLLTFGASLHHVEADDRAGHRGGVALSPTTLDDLTERLGDAYLGATCGRCANRIRSSELVLEGARVQLAANEGPHHLHGGPDGFSHRIWELAEVATTDDGGRASMVLRSEAGDQGYPGTLDAIATFELHGHVLRITYEATTDATTVVNLTNHAYWNLGGPAAWSIEGSIADHELRVPADAYLPTDAEGLPAPALAAVDGTAFDLRHAPLLDDVLGQRRRGLDHSYPVPQVVEVGVEPDGLHLAAELHHPTSGRTLTVRTDQPAIQVYTANHLGPPFAAQAAVCLEAQRFADAPNRPDLGDVTLHPGERYHATTELTFGVR